MAQTIALERIISCSVFHFHEDTLIFRFHELSHTCASLLIQNRTPLIEVQQWLGHSTLETTASLYAHLEYETKINSAETLKKI